MRKRQPQSTSSIYPLAEEHRLALSEDEVGAEVVDVLHDGGDLGEFFPYRPDKVVFRREHRSARHKHEHHLSRLKAAPHQHMAQKALSRVLVVGCQPERRQQPAHSRDYPVGGLVLDAAAVDAHDMVGARLVHARDYPAPFVGVERSLHLVAVVVRDLHADDRLGLAKPSEQAADLGLLEAQLVGIGGVELAAAALFVDRAAVRFRVIHKISPCAFLILFYRQQTSCASGRKA